MGKKLLALTPELSKIIDETRSEFLRYGLSTVPADVDTAEAAIASLYESIDLKRPHFVRLSSPLGAELYINLLRQTRPKMVKEDQLGVQLRRQLRGQLGDQLGDQLGRQLGDQLWIQLGDRLRRLLGGLLGGQLRRQIEGELGGQLWRQLGDQLWIQLWRLGDQLGDQLRGQLGDQLGDQLRDHLRGMTLCYTGTWFWGQQDHVWAWLEGGRRVGVRYSETLSKALDNHLAILRSCGWWYPFCNFCIVTDRPELIARDTEGRLHSESGPALRFRDGYAVYAHHGTRIPAQWIEDQTSLTASVALTWENIEQRRAACEILGWDSVLTQLDAKTIDRDADPEVGELVEVELPDVGRERFLRVRCGTGRRFALPVPPQMRSALEANAWTYGFDVDNFQKPEVRT